MKKFNSKEGKRWLSEASKDGWKITESVRFPNTSTLSAYNLSKAGFRGFFFVNERISFLYFYTMREAFIDMSMTHKGLWIEIPDTYSWENMQRSLRICGECGKEGETHQLYVSGRACMNCIQKEVARC